MVYCDGRLTLLTLSRKHGFNSRCLFLFVLALAEGLRVPCEIAGSATFRKPRKKGGVEGDETFYFGPHAEIMKGGKDIDLDTQPPPDLAIEIEVSHSADDAVTVWGRLGVPEIWRFDPVAWSALSGRAAGTGPTPRSLTASHFRCSPPLMSLSR